MIPKESMETATACATSDTRKDVGGWLTSGRSENSEMVREELMFGTTPSCAPYGLLSEDR
jgi:hypothetical protein